MPELNEMQAAAWVGGHSAAAADGVSAHLSMEFDGAGLAPGRLEPALRRLLLRHPALRLAVDSMGQGRVLPVPAGPLAAVRDLRGSAEAAVAGALAAQRRMAAHRRLDLAGGRGLELRLSLLPGGRHRLHLDLDMVAADPSCVPQLLDELALFAEDPEAVLPETAPPECREAEAAAEDQRWWQDHLGTLPPAPRLPAPQGSGGPETLRLADRLGAAERQALELAARRARVTPSALMLALFASVLGRATGQQALRLTLPHFLRAPGEAGRIGEFSGILPFAAELREGDTLAARAARTWTQMAGLIARRGSAGPGLMRALSRQSGRAETLPVVFTSGLGIGAEGLVSARARRVLGELVHTVSQGPGVALDVQVAELGGGLLVNWDLRADRIAEGWAREVFAAHLGALRRLAADPDLAGAPLGGWLSGPQAAPLSALQSAYLAGRGTGLPLGGIAMQEMRAFRGDMEVGTLRTRLERLVARHPGLRTVIDAEAGLARVQERHPVNLEELDLRALDPEAAEARLAELAERLGNADCPLDHAPWHVLAVRLPEGMADRLAVFLRADALILDGGGIARIAAELCGAEPAEDRPAPAAPPADPAADAAWWQARAAELPPPPELPWLAPLADIRASRHRRISVTVPDAKAGQLARIGARAGLFRNTVLTALLCEALARWTPDLSLRIGIPVAPAPGARAAANRSSFIPAGYRVTAEDGPQARAKALQAEILAGLAHGGGAGVAVNRMLLASGDSAVALPVVVTNGLGWAVPPDGALRQTGGLVRTPQTALDLRLVRDGSGDLRIDADFALAALSPATVEAVLADVLRAVDESCAQGVLCSAPRRLAAQPEPETARGAGFLEAVAARIFGGADDSPALACGDSVTGAADLGRQVAAAIAGFRAQGLQTGDTVAICLPKGPEHVVLQIAAAMEGLVWVPVDAASPPERLAYLLETCRPRLVVARALVPGHRCTAPAALMAAPGTEGWPVPRDVLAERSRSGAPGYFLFTSGTTGRPKGVVLSNRATSNVLAATIAEWGVGPGDAILSATPLHHDMSLFDIFGVLAAGGLAVLPEEGAEKDARGWAELVARHRVSLWVSVPAILEMLLAVARPGELDSLRLVAQGGDFVKPATIGTLRALLPAARLWSLGGPTETTVWSIWHAIAPDETGQVPYGRALPGARHEILNPAGEPCPEGVTGRIHTLGPCLSLGYLSADGLSQADFPLLQDSVGRRLRAFRTGDQGWRRADGAIMFAARVGGYVKVRGVRVSMGDVEDALARHPGILQVMAADCGDPAAGDVTLAALFVPAPGTVPDPAALRSFLRDRLPASHMPDRFVPVDALPVTANGKPDRVRARQIAAAPPTPSGMAAEVLRRYLDATGAPAEGAGPDSPFLGLGLRPSHLAGIAAGLNAAFGTALAPADLLPCRTAREVETLLARHASAP
ncbi:AMP-binding protein [Mangrovicoccus sp. HB161399]|uniref:AMP-binding protein n=1 Tax=Mangrovicoccus sp. HB161399 TaxID=2720392 RepID=UPI0015524142|nr:AMP-binding protein [Mangrovicoccus sp. HB161399]